MMKSFLNIVYNSIPIAVMILLIPFVRNDLMLTGLYCVIIAISFMINFSHHELKIFIFGFVVMTIAEYFFVASGVETFTRNSFLYVMPLWLPFLWGYSFVAIKRALLILKIKKDR